MTKIIAVRHGESVANTQGIYQGQTFDTDLSVLGKKQAQRLAKRLAMYKFSNIYTSPLKRTVQTAEAVAKTKNLKIALSRGIMETNHGRWEGKSKIWIKKNYSGLYEKWLKSPSETAFPEGELFLETVKRVENFFMRRVWKGNNLIVTHDNIVRIMICLAENKSFNDLWSFDVEPAAINVFEIKGINGRKRLRSVIINDTKHLKGLRADIQNHAL